MVRDTLLQICQVLAVLLLAPLLQGINPAIRRARSARAGTRHFPALSRSVEAFSQADRRTGDCLLDLLDRAVRRLYRDAHRADPHPGIDRFSSAAFRHGRHSRRRADPHARVVHDRARRARYRQRLWRHRIEPRGDGGDLGRADPDPGIRRHHALGKIYAALRRQSSARRQPCGIFEPGSSVSHLGFFHAADRRNRSPADPFQHAHRSLYDRGGAHPRIFRSTPCHAALGLDDEAIHPLCDLLQCFADPVGPVASRVPRSALLARLPR